MESINKKIKRGWYKLILTLLLSFLLIGTYVFMTSKAHTDQYSNRFDGFVRNKMKNIIKSEVYKRLHDIKYDFNRIELEEKILIKKKIDSIASYLTKSEIKNIKNKKLKRKKIIQLFESIVTKDPDYLYFLLSNKGEMLRSGTHSEINGINMYEFKDKNNVYFIKELLKSVDIKTGVYASYYWPKKNGGEPLEKISYAFYIKEYDIVIGVGSYYKDIKDNLKRDTIDRLNNYYEGSSDYIFIHSYSGKSLVHSDKSLIGKDLSKAKDINGQHIHDIVMEIIKDKKEGFLNYHFKNIKTGEISEKLTFVKAVPEWNAFIGMGFYIDDLSKTISFYKKELLINHYKDVSIAMLLLGFISVVVFIIGKNLFNLYLKLIKREDFVFQQLISLSSEGIIIINDKEEILFKNSVIEKILGSDLKGLDFYNNLYKIDDSVNQTYRFKNKSGGIRYFELNDNYINYKGNEAKIYFIKDITKQFLKHNELETIANYDELTGLRNRRKLLDDFENLDLDNRYILGIIDIDFFKKINDNYGHDRGDDILKLLASIFKKEKDIKLYRFGGEEFVVIIKGLSLKESKLKIEQLNIKFKKLSLDIYGLNTTFSGGLVRISGDVGFDDLFKKADNLLYKAKKNGRNRIEI